MAKQQDLPLLSKEEFKQKLEKGETIENCKIERISMSKKDVNYAINITDCEIEFLDLNKSVFTEDITIRRCTIGNLILSEATFQKKFDIKKCRVGRGRVQKTSFEGPALFEGGKFSFTSFHQSSFSDKTDFSYSSFHGEGNFNEVVFRGDAKFNYSHFDNKGNFPKTQWDGKVTFNHSKVDDDLDFTNSKFNGDLLFNGAIIKLDLKLSGCQLEGSVDLRQVIAGRSIILMGAKLGENQTFQLRSASSPSILIDREVVEGHIYPENEGQYTIAAEEYGFLRTIFQNINRFDDEDWAYYQFKRMQRMGKETWNPIDRAKRLLEYLFLDIGCGYGTKPFRTLMVGGLLIVFFALCYFLHFGNEPIAAAAQYKFTANWINNLVYAFDTSLVAFSGGYGDISLKGTMRLVAMFEYLIGVVFMGLFIVAFSRKVIR